MFDKNTVDFVAPPFQPTAFVLACFVILASVPAVADVVIELTDGRHITVPVDKGEVERITFTPTSPKEGSKPKTARDRSSRTADVVRPSEPGTWRVGAERALKYPSDAAKKAKDGDLIEIDAGTYHNDHAIWKQSNITIRGIGGMAHLKSKGLICLESNRLSGEKYWSQLVIHFGIYM